jgi:hypothetical protein
MSPTVGIPAATARSPHRRSADQKAIRCAGEQKRFGEPPRRAMKDRPHQKQVVQVTAAGNPSPGQRSWKAEQAVEPVRAIEM